ncbi:MgtC/SapB family protein [Allobranchiibius huperziae]|uniref:Putative Mg2+ transporter-C (MgtC) family protein n=1 Tax=Allobranchiibius huperziae TaxID=1874116 RepID=A0A853DFQ4_9MICO|nr:MgtC/SapB family protein [Allobranchiibius huperziae]NYJ73500.1 putative Mg2+ transporter-C (MgtC) family protein [Allobranchiibius huperziae]
MAHGPFAGQGVVQIAELLLAFVLSSGIGLERTLRGKSAGLRTQSIVGTTAAAILLVSKYGFTDVLHSGSVVLDPSRVAAQVVSGIGFLGAGLILSRGGVVRGLTTAAAVWETAAIGMAAGAGLWLIALVVTALHFVTVFGYTELAHHLPGSPTNATRLQIIYTDGRGVLRSLINRLTALGWRVDGLTGMQDSSRLPEGVVGVVITASGQAEPERLVKVLSGVDDVVGVGVVEDDDELE